MPPRPKQLSDPDGVLRADDDLRWSDSDSKWISGGKYRRNLSVISPNLFQRGFGSVGVVNNFWTTANLAVYVPILIEKKVTVQRVVHANGSLTSSNYDIGIYEHDGTLLNSLGSTAQSGASQAQANSLSQELDPGRYYLAMAANLASGGYYAFFARASADASLFGVKIQTSAFPLPSTATFSDPTVADGSVPCVALLVES